MYVPARPPRELEQGWTVEPLSGFARAGAPRVSGDGDEVTLDGAVAWVPDAPGADLLVVVGVDGGGRARGGGRRVRRRGRGGRVGGPL